MKLTLATIGWIAGLGALAAVSISAINHKKEMVVSGLDVRIIEIDEGEYFLTKDDVRHEIVVMLGDTSNVSLSTVEVDEIESALMHNPFIADVDVYVSSDGELGVSVEQKVPLVRVFDAKGNTYYVDRTGDMIPVSNYFTARVPVITGHVVPDPEDEKWLSLQDMLLTFDADDFMKPLVEQIDVSRSNDITVVPKVGDAEVFFGKPVDIEVKIENLKAFYKDVVAEYGWDRYERIDLSIEGQIIGKKKPNHNQ